MCAFVLEVHGEIGRQSVNSSGWEWCRDMVLDDAAIATEGGTKLCSGSSGHLSPVPQVLTQLDLERHVWQQAAGLDLWGPRLLRHHLFLMRPCHLLQHQLHL